MRPFGFLTKEDILNEARAIRTLYKAGDPVNLVAVIDHGWLLDSPYYYIDMELCDGNLETYITSNTPWMFDLENPRLLGAPISQRGDWNLWDIMEQITNGIEFI